MRLGVTLTMKASGAESALPDTPHWPFRLVVSTSTSSLVWSDLKKSFTVLDATHFDFDEISGPEADRSNSFGALMIAVGRPICSFVEIVGGLRAAAVPSESAAAAIAAAKLSSLIRVPIWCPANPIPDGPPNASTLNGCFAHAGALAPACVTKL
jgi:hypothetical protein